MTDITEAQVEAAAKALRDDKANRTDTYKVPEWADTAHGDKIVYRGMARAALEAAQAEQDKLCCQAHDEAVRLNGIESFAMGETDRADIAEFALEEMRASAAPVVDMEKLAAVLYEVIADFPDEALDPNRSYAKQEAERYAKAAADHLNGGAK